MPGKRRRSLKIELAAALLQLRDANGERLIPHEHAKLMTADQIISLFHCDHYPVPHSEGGPYEPWNLTHRFIADHKEKTATIDIPQIAKGKRIRRREAEHRQALVVGEINTGKMSALFMGRKAKIPSRPFQKGPRPFRRSR